MAAAILVFAGAILGGSPGASPTPGASVPAATTAGTAALEPITTATGSPTTPEVRCDASEQFTMHIHAHLAIRVDGQLYEPPADVGITAQCFYWLHTHSATGIIHVEAPTQADYTLGQFFEVWGVPLSTTQVADHAVGPGQSLYVFIDGQRQEGVDPATIILRNLESIELQIGTAPLDPLPYTFPAGFQ